MQRESRDPGDPSSGKIPRSASSHCYDRPRTPWHTKGKVVAQQARYLVLCLTVLYITASYGRGDAESTVYDEEREREKERESRMDNMKARARRRVTQRARFCLFRQFCLFSSCLLPSSSPLSCSSLVQERIDCCLRTCCITFCVSLYLNDFAESVRRRDGRTKN